MVLQATNMYVEENGCTHKISHKLEVSLREEAEQGKWGQKKHTHTHVHVYTHMHTQAHKLTQGTSVASILHAVVAIQHTKAKMVRPLEERNIPQ